MDYEEKYNKLVEAIRVLQETNPSDEGIQNWVNDNVPELHDNEDERIRKWLLDELHLLYHQAAGDKEREENFIKAIAWLKNISYTIDHEKREGFHLGYKTGLEKQGEQKPFNYENANIQQKDFAPKVKPKFKIGDWIVSKTSNLVYRVDSILFPQSKCYYLSHNGGIVVVNYTDEQNYRLWTIKDAKDGDVLVEDSCIFIIQKLGDNSTAAKTYCTLYDDGDFDGGSILYFDIDSTKPATKEQRDLLFQKMKEAGYEWDVELKQLKKIEHKPAWSEEDERITEIKTFIAQCNGFNKANREKVFKMLKSLRPQNTWKPSDEQMKALHDLNLTGNISYAGQGQELINLYNDLKKLREE